VVAVAPHVARQKKIASEQARGPVDRFIRPMSLNISSAHEKAAPCRAAAVV
jgi:hypothetical protein